MEIEHTRFYTKCDAIRQNALFIFMQDWSRSRGIKRHLKGADCQLKIWEVLFKIPSVGMTAYGDIAPLRIKSEVVPDLK